MRLVLRRLHKALSTEKSYLFWLRRYIAAVSRMPPHLPSEQKLERFLSDLARERDVSASTQNQAFNALLYFYRVVLGASHCLARGMNPRAIQLVMGHGSMETTMGYFHAEALSVSSPLDALPVALPGPDALSDIGTAAESIIPRIQRPCQSPHTLNSSNTLPTKRLPSSIPVRPMLRPTGGPITNRAPTLSRRQAVGSSVRPYPVEHSTPLPVRRDFLPSEAGSPGRFHRPEMRRQP